MHRNGAPLPSPPSHLIPPLTTSPPFDLLCSSSFVEASSTFDCRISYGITATSRTNLTDSAMPNTTVVFFFLGRVPNKCYQSNFSKNVRLPQNRCITHRGPTPIAERIPVVVSRIRPQKYLDTNINFVLAQFPIPCMTKIFVLAGKISFRH